MPRYYSINYLYAGGFMLILGLIEFHSKPLDETNVDGIFIALLLIVLGGFLMYLVAKSYWKMIKFFSYCLLIVSALLLWHNTDLTIWLHGKPQQYDIMEQMFKYVWQQRESLATKKLIDDIQQKFWCCGFNGVSDYPKENIPLSCCQDYNCDLAFKVFTRGCYDVFENTVPVFLSANKD